MNVRSDGLEPANMHIHEDHRLASAPLGGSLSPSVAELTRSAGMLRWCGGRFLIDLAA
jgi:hypothetical protein